MLKKPGARTGLFYVLAKAGHCIICVSADDACNAGIMLVFDAELFQLLLSGLTVLDDGSFKFTLALLA